MPLGHQVVELAARWYVFLFLKVYGIGKIAGGQFYRRGRLPEEVAGTLLGEASAFDLAWTFMGYSFAYILFIGLADGIETVSTDTSCREAAAQLVDALRPESSTGSRLSERNLTPYPKAGDSS